MATAHPIQTERNIPLPEVGGELARLTAENARLREAAIDLDVELEGALANNRTGWAEVARLEIERVRLIAENERLRISHTDLYARWSALQGTPYSRRAVYAEAAVVNKDRLIASLRAELSDLKGVLSEYGSFDEEAER